MPPGSRATMNGTTQTLRLSMGGMLIQRDIRPADRQTCRSRALRVPSVRRVSFQTHTVPPSVAGEVYARHAKRRSTRPRLDAGWNLRSAEERAPTGDQKFRADRDITEGKGACPRKSRAPSALESRKHRNELSATAGHRTVRTS
jgi:hypothetical protein